MLNFKEASAGEHFWEPPGFMAKYRTGRGMLLLHHGAEGLAVCGSRW